MKFMANKTRKLSDIYCHQESRFKVTVGITDMTDITDNRATTEIRDIMDIQDTTDIKEAVHRGFSNPVFFVKRLLWSQ
jgi:hypothetical protein